MTNITSFPNLAYDIIDLISNDRLSTADIEDKLPGSSASDIRYAIRRLQEHEVIQIEPNLMDMRSSTYRLSDQKELKESEKMLTPELFQRVMTTITNINTTIDTAHV